MSLIEFRNADIFRQGQIVLKDVNWKMSEGESWVVLGNIASGKTTILQAVAGLLHIKSGEAIYNISDEPVSRWELKKYITLVSFSNRLVNGSEYYYQQRYNFSEADDIPTVRQYLGDHDFSATHFAILKIDELLHVELVKLSNGQTRRVILAKALAAKPRILVLDNPFAGLDLDTRESLRSFIDGLIAHGQKVIMSCMHPEDIPTAFTHVLHLTDCRIDFQTPLVEFNPVRASNDETARPRIYFAPVSEDFEIAVKLTNVSVRYGEKLVLDRINWQVLKGEKWALLGKNGSGKSTLLSLLNADNPQAYNNNIILFDEQRRSGQSIWQIKKRIGFFSPELQAYFNEDLNVFDVIATGYTDKFVPLKNLTEGQELHVDNLLSYYSKLELRHRKYLQLSSGEQRLVMFLRSLVKQVDLLILDEPFQGFDEHLIKQSKVLLDEYCRNITLLFVTHYKSEIPGCVNNVLTLESGRIVQ